MGNVLGYAGMEPVPPYQTSFAYEDTFPWDDDPVGLWRLGYNPENWDAPADPKVLSTVVRHGNYDFATNTQKWDPNNANHNIPASFYLTQKPPFFGSNPWPWVNPANGAVTTLPARARFDAIHGL